MTSSIVQLVGGYNAAKQILDKSPAAAVYWDRFERTYIKDFKIDPDAGYVTFNYLAVSNWLPCDSIDNPIETGDFILLADLEKEIPLSNAEYFVKYYAAQQVAQANVITENHYLKNNETAMATKSNLPIRLWIFVLVMMVGAILRGCL